MKSNRTRTGRKINKLEGMLRERTEELARVRVETERIADVYVAEVAELERASVETVALRDAARKGPLARFAAAWRFMRRAKCARHDWGPQGFDVEYSDGHWPPAPDTLKESEVP